MDRRHFLHRSTALTAALLGVRCLPGCGQDGGSGSDASLDTGPFDANLPSSGPWWLQGNYSPVLRHRWLAGRHLRVAIDAGHAAGRSHRGSVGGTASAG